MNQITATAKTAWPERCFSLHTMGLQENRLNKMNFFPKCSWILWSTYNRKPSSRESSHVRALIQPSRSSPRNIDSFWTGCTNTRKIKRSRGISRLLHMEAYDAVSILWKQIASCNQSTISSFIFRFTILCDWRWLKGLMRVVEGLNFCASVL